MRILIIEDDELMGDCIRSHLTDEGYTADWLTTGESAIHALHVEQFDLIILDLGLPKMRGEEFLQIMRSEGKTIPVIILAASDEVGNRIKSLDIGADDYIAKPVDLNELSARIRALLRRFSGRTDSLLAHKGITLDPSSHRVTLAGKAVELSRREFSLLYKLLENINQVISREHLMQSLYGWEKSIDSNTLEVHIYNLRRKLKTNEIKTIRGVGYMIHSEDKD